MLGPERKCSPLSGISHPQRGPALGGITPGSSRATSVWKRGGWKGWGVSFYFAESQLLHISTPNHHTGGKGRGREKKKKKGIARTPANPNLAKRKEKKKSTKRSAKGLPGREWVGQQGHARSARAPLAPPRPGLSAAKRAVAASSLPRGPGPLRRAAGTAGR